MGSGLGVLAFGIDLGDQDVGFGSEIGGEFLPYRGKSLAVWGRLVKAL